VTTDLERLRRELRATAAVNRQLQAQLDEPHGAPHNRRVSSGLRWLEELSDTGPSKPSLVRATDGAVFVIEGPHKRSVRSGLLAAAVEELLGPPRAITDQELEGYANGVPVELLESSGGPPFLVLGGQRHPTVGVPLPYPVDFGHASVFAEGAEINVAAANVARRRFAEAMTGELQLARMRNSLTTRGALGTAKAAARRLKIRIRRDPRQGRVRTNG
jgi:hypothetical protein